MDNLFAVIFLDLLSVAYKRRFLIKKSICNNFRLGIQPLVPAIPGLKHPFSHRGKSPERLAESAERLKKEVGSAPQRSKKKKAGLSEAPKRSLFP